MTPTRDAQSIARTVSRLLKPQRLDQTRSHARHVPPSSVPRRGRDVIARYRPDAPPPAIPPHRYRAVHAEAAPAGGEFATSSTQPVGTSFQTVPPPESPESTGGVQIKQPVPAMLAVPASPESPTTAPAGSPGSSSSGAAGPQLEPAQARGVMVVQGVPVPPKPRPPGEEECCMSGCVHCVYTIYADELEEYNEALAAARDALVAAGTPSTEWPDEVRAKDRSAGDQVEKQKDKVMETVDPAMAAFLALEGKLKKKSSS